MPKKTAPSDLALLRPLWDETIHRTTLPNGLTVLLKPDHSSALCSVQVWVNTGSIHEGALLGAGLSHFLEHMLFKGTAKRAGREISATVQSYGGYINAYTTFDRTVYYIEIPSEHAAVAVDLLADATLHSTLPADEFERERQVILREIDMTLDDPDQRLGQMIFETAFRRHPYRHPIIGHRSVFESVKHADLVDYYRARYVPNNLTVVVVGHFEPDAMRAEIERHFGATPRASLAPIFLPEEPPPLAPRESHFSEDVKLTRAGIGYQIPGLAHPDAPTLDLLGIILGHGNSSLLWRELRERRRLVHSIDAGAWNPGSVGLFFISFECDPEKRLAAAAAIRSRLEQFSRVTLSPALLRKAVRQLVVSELNARKTMSGQASRLGTAEVVVGDLRYSQHYFERLARTTIEDIRRVAKTYFTPERLTSVSITPKQPPAKNPPIATAATLGDFEEIRLSNGARLLLLPDHRLPNLHLRLACLGGPTHEPAHARGAVSVLATLLTKDTTRRSAEEVAETIEEVGGRFSHFSGNNSFGLSLEVLPADFDRALSLLSDATFHPKFDAKQLATEIESHLAELAAEEDDVVSFARKRARAKFFTTHPLAIDSSGTAKGIRACDAATLRALHRSLIIAPNTVLAVTGDFSRNKILPKLRAFLEKIPVGTKLTAEPSHSPPPASKTTEKLPRQQAIVHVAFPSPGIQENDYYASELADELFSGMASQLFERVREQKGLAYFVRSARVVGLRTGMFAFYAGTSPQKASEVISEIDAEIARVQRGDVTKEELARCRTRLKAARRMSLQTNSARAMQAALNALYGLPVNDWKNYDAHIDAVSAKHLQTFAQKRFDKKLRTEFIVTP